MGRRSFEVDGKCHLFADYVSRKVGRMKIELLAGVLGHFEMWKSGRLYFSSQQQ